MTEPARVPLNPVQVPTLMDLVADSSEFDRLPQGVQDDLYEQVAGLEARLRAKVLGRHRPEERAEPDRALKIEEAAALLAMTKDFIYRNWKKLGGYRDTDGHVKFALSDLQRHLRRARR